MFEKKLTSVETTVKRKENFKIANRIIIFIEQDWHEIHYLSICQVNLGQLPLVLFI